MLWVVVLVVSVIVAAWWLRALQSSAELERAAIDTARARVSLIPGRA
jgi:hypothetical protein